MADKKINAKSAATPKAASNGKSKTPAKAASVSVKKEKSLTDLVGTLAEKLGITKAKAREFCDAHGTLIGDELKQNGSVLLIGIGKLKLGDRPARTGRNPATGESIAIKASKTVKFAAGKAFKDSFN